MANAPKNSADAIEIELIRSLYDGLVPSIIMSLGFVIGGLIIIRDMPDRSLLVLFFGGVAASALRLAIVWIDRRRAASVALTITDAHRLERRFAVTYIAFALMLGLFGARIFTLPATEPHLFTLCLLIGYAAGVAAGVGLRPRIATTSLLLAVVPPVAAMVTTPHLLYLATAAMTSALLAGGIFSLRRRHARALTDIGRRLTFAALARHDGLTAIPNRLALREWFDETVLRGERSLPLVAVHCLDLNGFKPVNDSFGHPTGDLLLAAVAQRLVRTLREGDMVARLGGDEFTIVQRDIAHSDEARLLAQRIVTAVGQTYSIGDREIQISTSVGFVLCEDEGRDLEQLISFADEALYMAKRSGRGVRQYDHAEHRSSAAAA
jgi:diguanylate cyclase (GGDEF)-like protein